MLGRLFSRNKSPWANEFNKGVLEHVKRFVPLRYYGEGNELVYQIDLARYLKSFYQNIVLEESRGSSRLDIAIKNLGIEVKGPTNTQALQSIADKLVRYSTHYDAIIIVMFDLQTTEGHYKEWHKGITRQFRDAQLVTIASPGRET